MPEDTPNQPPTTEGAAASPAHQAFVRNVAPERNEQEPLGPAPTYDDVLDVAVEYTFPASDPVAVQSCCKDVAARERGEEPSRDG